MDEQQEKIQWQTTTGEAVTVGDLTVKPQAQAVSVRWPNGGFVWNRPVAVLVERGGQQTRLPIVDVTRLAQIGLFGISAIFTTIFLMLSMKRKKVKS